MVRNTPKNAESTAKAKLPPFVRGLLCIGTVLLVCFVVSIVLEVWYCKSAPNAAIKLAACLVLDAFAFLLPGVEESAAKPTIAGRCKHRSLQTMCNVRSTRQGRIPLRWRSPLSSTRENTLFNTLRKSLIYISR